jgi:putative acetyltransferase
MVREYKASDLEEVVALFGRSVREIAARDYSPTQVSAWAPQVPDRQVWSKRLSEGATFVCECEDQIVGFARIVETGHLDLLYVHPEFQRQGVARALCERALAWAKSRGIPRLTSDASVTACPFFERIGFRVVKPHDVEFQGVSFQNFHMERDIDAEPRVAAARP